MSLLWKWGQMDLLRRCHKRNPSSLFAGSFTSRIISSMTLLSSSSIKHTSLLSLSSLSLSSHHLLSQVRFKSGVKTHSGSKKRFRVRGSGSIKRGKSGKSHNTGYKHRQRANRLGSSTGITGKKIEQRVRKLLGVFNG